MTLPAFGLLLIAALLHVGWNLLLKRAGGKPITLWWGFVFGALAGWLWLKEKFGFVRVAGALVIFSGILIILIAG